MVYEKNNYLGGHTDTHSLNIAGQTINIDSGFIVFTRAQYPCFSAMLDDLGIASKPTNMSFSVVNENSGTHYNATDLNRLFCQRSNLIKPRFYQMIADIIRFYKSAPAVLKSTDELTTVKAYLQQHRYSTVFMRDHLFPMIGALWSAAPATVEQFPIRYLVEYMHSHGMMNLWKRPQWRTLTNGSNEYVARLKTSLGNTEFRVNCGVSNVIRETDRVLIHANSCEPEYFDAVIFANHSDQARMLLQKPSKDENEILSAIPFQKNDIIIHTDPTIMPDNRRAWASWNARVTATQQAHCCATYWMNSLQGLTLDQDVFVSLNENQPIEQSKVLHKRTYHHPVYTASSVAARRKLTLINGKNRSFYVGAYWGWGFHEDGACSAVEAVSLLKNTLSESVSV